jgi:DNA-binding NtrC family response regulator
MPIIVLTAYASIATAVEAMREGATDYATKPFDNADIAHRIERCLQGERMRMEHAWLRRDGRQGAALGALIGRSPGMRAVFDMIERVADSDSAVLVTGETGTGKELVAREIHRRSRRSGKLLVPVHIAGIPSELLESELFGHERGAFTGATVASPGLLEMADAGTLFLDEIGEAPLHLQPKLLRVLQDGVLRRIGSTRERHVDLRLVSATNRDLQQMVEAGTFRADLYYRLRVIEIRVPPLRERAEDIALLAAHFVEEVAARLGRHTPAASRESLEALEACPWPGNVRELRNAVERAVVLARGDILDASLFDFAAAVPVPAPAAASEAAESSVCLTDMVDHFEREAIEGALTRAGGVKRRAAELLGLSERTFWYKLRKHGIG